MDVHSRQGRDALHRAIKTSDRVLEADRRTHRSLVKDYLGSVWGENAASQPPCYINLMALAADAYVTALAASCPRAYVSTYAPKLNPFARKFQSALNKIAQEIKLEVVLRRAVLDAFFSMGIVKVYLAPGNPVELEIHPPEPGMNAEPWEWEQYQRQQHAAPFNVYIDAGQPFAENISRDDFIYDTQAPHWERIRFAAHRYRVPFDSLKQDDRLDRSVVKNLQPTSKWRTSSPDQEPGVKDMKAWGMDHDELEEMITLCDIWLPESQQWAIVADGFEGQPPLYVDDWDGPERGPFHILALGDAPEHIEPLSPAHNLQPLHNIINNLMRKQVKRARNAKTVLGYMGHEGDAKSVLSAGDMEAIRLSDPRGIQEYNFNHVDNNVLAFQQLLDNTFNRIAGNLDAISGLGPMSDTARQDELIHAAVTSRIGKMQYKVTEFTAGLFRDLGWMLWVNSVKTMGGETKIPGLPLPIDETWTPEDREGDFLDYNFKIDPHSMTYKSPQQRLDMLMQIASQVLLPVLPMAQQEGVALDTEEFVRKLSELADLPELSGILNFNGQKIDLKEQNGSAPKPNMPRTYIRKSVSTGGTPQGQRQQMMQQAMSVAKQ